MATFKKRLVINNNKVIVAEEIGQGKELFRFKHRRRKMYVPGWMDGWMDG